MTKRVELPDGNVAEFPDDFTPEQMSASIQKSFGAPRETDSFTKRIGAGVLDPIYGAAQLADRALVNPIRQAISPGATSMEDVIRARDAEYRAPQNDMDWARLLGNLANPINWVGGGSLRALAGAGAVQGLASPTAADQPLDEFVGSKAIQAGIGAGAGAAVGAVGAGLTNIGNRFAQSAAKPTSDVEKLLAQGINPTVGQAAGPNSILGRTEQALTSFPIAGDIITGARNRPIKEFGEWALNDAVKDIGGAGVKTLDEANQLAREAYEAVVPKLKGDFDLYLYTEDAIKAAKGNPELTKGNRKLFERVANDVAERTLQIGDKGSALKHLDSELGSLVRKYDAGDPAQQTLADAFRTLQTGFREGLAAANPDQAAGLNAANAAYRKLVPLNKAASRRGDEMITPRNLQLELARQAGIDPSRLQNPVVDAALRTIPSTVPDSGTAGRSALTGALTGSLAGGAFLPTVAGIGAASALYSKVAQRYLTSKSRTGRNTAARLARAAGDRTSVEAALLMATIRSITQQEQQQ